MNKKSILPYAIEDTNNLALEKCMQEAFSFDISDCLKYPVDNVRSLLLPILAEEEHILGAEGWNLAQRREEKVKIIKNSFFLHSTKGAIPALIKALKILNINAKISEFWEYGGKIGHFLFELLNIKDRVFNIETEKEINELINAYKPATRILDKINYFFCNEGVIYSAARVRTLEKVTISTREVVL